MKQLLLVSLFISLFLASSKDAFGQTGVYPWPDSLKFSNLGGSLSVTVYANNSSGPTSWTVDSGWPSWIQIISPPSGGDSALCTITVAPNGTDSSRSYTLGFHTSDNQYSGSLSVTQLAPRSFPYLVIELPSEAYSSDSIALSATSNSEGTITFSIISGPDFIDGNNVLTFNDSGKEVTVRATVSSTDVYYSTTSNKKINVRAINPATGTGWVNGYFIGPYVDLSSAQLHRANLVGANFTGSNLSSADLSFSHMTDTNLTDASLHGTNLTNAALYFAMFAGAYLQDADLTDATLFGATSGGITGTPVALPVDWILTNGYLFGPNADLSGVNLSAANLSGYNLSGADLSGANLNTADLSATNLSGANMNNVDLVNAILDNVQSGGVTGTPTALPVDWILTNGYLFGPNADLSGANLSAANLSGYNLSGANLSGANLNTADLSATNLSGANMTIADLSYANLKWANLQKNY